MANCPVCNQEYTEGTVEFCPRCAWYLAPYPSILGEIPSEIQKRDQQTLLWAKKIWEKSYQLHKQNSQLQQQLEAAKKTHQNPQNNSLLEQHLQNISSNIQSLPEMLNVLQQINEHLGDQSNNFNRLFQSQQLAYQENLSSNETKSENEISEPEDLSNPNEHSHDHNIIYDAEVYDLVENYNQRADFPDKIEVSETEHSKSQRWGGSQEPAVFEPNYKGRGDYWIINNQYLVPKPKQKINEHSYKTISILFECFNYEQNATDNMTLIKPAKVSSINGEEKWQLEEMGTLEF
jgi:hypothetical protein